MTLGAASAIDAIATLIAFYLISYKLTTSLVGGSRPNPSNFSTAPMLGLMRGTISVIFIADLMRLKCICPICSGLIQPHFLAEIFVYLEQK